MLFYLCANFQPIRVVHFRNRVEKYDCREVDIDHLYNVLGPGSLPGLAIFLMGNTPDHLAATAVVTAEGAIFGIRRRRACLGMPTDGGRRNTLWRCTNVWMWQ